MSIVNYDALRQGVVQHDPFDYLIVPGFISPDTLQVVNADYPDIESAANHELESLAYGPKFGEIMAALRGPKFAAIIGEQFDMDLATLPTTVTVRKYCERTDGNIHTDHKSKVLTVLVYFNETWEHEDGQLRMLRSKDNIDDYAAQVTPL
ncbi:MAG: 2OG-Fe(II) oxygenase, partial [Halioglobus sp.]|nr:2OG-Fe(II) oxygenase [Halioglobus sp.]